MMGRNLIMEGPPMPSPFPGMNPYLEQVSVWRGFHERLLPRMADRLGEQILPRYFVDIDETLYVHPPDEHRRLIGYGDAVVTDARRNRGEGGTTAMIEAPSAVWQEAVEQERWNFLEIRDR